MPMVYAAVPSGSPHRNVTPQRSARPGRQLGQPEAEPMLRHWLRMSLPQYLHIMSYLLCT